MTARTPLVMVAGQIRELPSGDTIGGAAWTSYTPIVNISSGSFGATPTATGAYTTIGKTTFVRISVTFGSIGSASGYPSVSLPVTPTGMQVIGGLDLSTGKALTLQTNNNLIRAADSAAPSIASGTQLLFTGLYEAA